MSVVLCLYIAGTSPNSALARHNLRLLCEGYLAESPPEVQVVDVLHQPELALQEGILVTPTLLRLSPGPKARVIGNLSDMEVVVHALGLGPV